MALFGPKNNPTAKNLRAQLQPPARPEEPDYGVRLIDGEATPRMNVPAIAMNGPRRANLSLPATQHTPPVYHSHTAERRLIVGRDISLVGEIAECDQLVVEGTIEATVGHGKQLYIAQTGLFYGTANADEADIAGRFEGELNVKHLRLRATSQFTGQLRFSQLEIEAGAQITGELQYVPLPAAAPENTTGVINLLPYQTAMQAAQRA